MDEIVIEKEEIIESVKKYNLAGDFQTSSKDNINVSESVNALIDSIFKFNPDLLQINY